MDWKSIGKKLIFPPTWVVVLLILVGAAGLFFVFSEGMDTSLWACPIYAAAFYALCVGAAYCIVILPKQYKNLRGKIYGNPVGRRYMTDPAFKTHVKLYASLTVNLLYAGANVLSWYLYRSVWFMTLAGYYGILAVMRFLLLRYIRGNEIGKRRLGELRRARLCSGILLLLNIVLTCTVMMILYWGKGFAYSGILIYVMASYTFYITTRAIVDLIKYRKYRSPVMTTAKVIALSAALVSMLNLETAMFAQFGGDINPEDQWLMIVLTGAGVSIAVIVMSVCMIGKTTKEIREIRKNGR